MRMSLMLINRSVSRRPCWVAASAVNGLALPVSRVLPFAVPEVVLTMTVSGEKQTTNITVIYHSEIKDKQACARLQRAWKCHSHRLAGRSASAASISRLKDSRLIQDPATTA